MISNAQAVELVAFLRARLPAAFTDASIRKANQDHPPGGAPWCTWRVASDGAQGGVMGSIPGTTPGGDPAIRTRTQERVEIEIEVGSRYSDTAPSLDDDAQRILSSLRNKLRSEVATYAMRTAGLAPVSIGNVLDLTDLVRDSQFETRALLTFVANRAEVDEDTTTSTIESVDLSGTATPVPGTVSEDEIA